MDQCLHIALWMYLLPGISGIFIILIFNNGSAFGGAWYAKIDTPHSLRNNERFLLVQDEKDQFCLAMR
jgi:hypothetical protein